MFNQPYLYLFGALLPVVIFGPPSLFRRASYADAAFQVRRSLAPEKAKYASIFSDISVSLGLYLLIHPVFFSRSFLERPSRCMLQVFL